MRQRHLVLVPVCVVVIIVALNLLWMRSQSESLAGRLRAAMAQQAQMLNQRMDMAERELTKQIMASASNTQQVLARQLTQTTRPAPQPERSAGLPPRVGRPVK
jgi:hypothetical protein